jgi:hypothetical protein
MEVTMPFDTRLDARMSKIISDWPDADRRKMFGGVCYLLKGNMACGVWRDFLILRLGEEAAAAALGDPEVKPFDITGRPMKGWIMVGSPGCEGRRLGAWLRKARAFAETLPGKR